MAHVSVMRYANVNENAKNELDNLFENANESESKA